MTSFNTIMMAVAALSVLAVLSGVHSAKYDVKDGRHNITMGHRRLNQYPPDMLLFTDNPKVTGTWFPYPAVQSNNVCYPTKGNSMRKVSITCFNVTDTMPKGDGGYVFIKSGGVDHGNVCFHLKTQRGKGYSFIVKIWGYYIL